MNKRPRLYVRIAFTQSRCALPQLPHVHAGRTILSSDAAQDLVAPGAPEASAGGALTPRELEVLALLVHGLSNHEIGGRLHRSQYTVRNHVSQIIHKLGAANRAEAAALAVRHELVSVIG